MRKTIYKYAVPVAEGVLEIGAPADLTVLHVAPHGTDVVLFWAMVDRDAPESRHVFRVAGTGHPIADDEHHVGSVQAPPFVWHLLRIGDPR